MSSAVYDSSAVDNYLNELSKREAEVTRTRQIDNTIKEVPYQVLRWAGRLLPIAILIWILGHAISNALSYERIVKNETISSTNSNAQDSKGWTCLHWCKTPEVAKVLLEELGAQDNIKNAARQTPEQMHFKRAGSKASGLADYLRARRAEINANKKPWE